jgi:hypothetical protein
MILNGRPLLIRQPLARVHYWGAGSMLPPGFDHLIALRICEHVDASDNLRIEQQFGQVVENTKGLR